MNIHRLYAIISPPFRRKRLRWFLRRLNMPPEERVLDVGGYPWNWDETVLPNPIALLNLSYPAGIKKKYPRFACTTGDACALPFADGGFDVVFSNSVIEHVGTWERQVQFAAEARRVGRKLWIQTPAWGFFIEPHLLAPFIHWLPVRWQRRLIRNFTPWGWFTRPSPACVDAFLAEVRLLTRPEMLQLFPDCEILEENFLGLTKSYIAVRTGRVDAGLEAGPRAVGAARGSASPVSHRPVSL